MVLDDNEQEEGSANPHFLKNDNRIALLFTTYILVPNTYLNITVDTILLIH